MTKHDESINKWLIDRLNLIKSIDEMWAKRIIEEMITNDFE
jgi:hypothetical protein